MRHQRNLHLALGAFAALSLVTGCGPSGPPPAPTAGVAATESAAPSAVPPATAFPPGTIFDYMAQQGDTLPAVAAHFNTTVEAIVSENPDLPEAVTTIPAGYLLRVPAYYVPLTSPPFQILPDSEAINGPGAVGFDLQAEVESRPGFLKGLTDYAQRRQRPAWEIVDVVARNYSIHPKVLLALLEHRTNALTKPTAEGLEATYPLGYEDVRHRGLYRQLIWAAESFNNAYYGWRAGRVELDLADGRISRPDPWQNAGTVGVHGVLAALYGQPEFDAAIGPDGFARTLRDLWGDPFAHEQVVIPPSLQQPELGLPFAPNRYWDFTGGPHPAWGDSLPWGALDLAPPSAIAGCAESGEVFTAPADGIVTTSDYAMLMLDLDGDGDQRTGWVLFFYHVGLDDQAPVGAVVRKGDPLGHPSCEGGRATGTHVHVARRYNGEWIPAGGTIPFEMGGWTAANGDAPYAGTMTRGSKVVPACECSIAENRIEYTLP
jgi:murein DD-endopeptidase MepM/ murein hydrolase activator NlpD